VFPVVLHEITFLPIFDLDFIPLKIVLLRISDVELDYLIAPQIHGVLELQIAHINQVSTYTRRELFSRRQSTFNLPYTQRNKYYQYTCSQQDYGLLVMRKMYSISTV
jgi:hypothetical protein